MSGRTKIVYILLLVAIYGTFTTPFFQADKEQHHDTYYGDLSGKKKRIVEQWNKSARSNNNSRIEVTLGYR